SIVPTSAMPLRDLGLKKLWSAVRAGSRTDSCAGGGNNNGGSRCEEAGLGGGGGEDTEPRGGPPTCSLPLLQVWPSQDSPRGEADGQSFVFPTEDGSGPSMELGLQHDSGIDSVQHNLNLKKSNLRALYLGREPFIREKFFCCASFKIGLHESGSGVNTCMNSFHELFISLTGLHKVYSKDNFI
ncbi:hypothetical protein L9F63_001578, partial [Diploptera punctata]